MKRSSFWIDSTPIKRFPTLQSNLNTDALVVGAGITGIMTAYLLKQAGLKVILTERERVASIDTGHTTAHLTYVTDVGLHELATNFGKDHAEAAWDAGAAAIDQIENIVTEEQLDCEFQRVPAYLYVPVDGFSEKDISSLKEEAELASEFGFDARYVKRVPYFELPGVHFANQAKFHPRKYLGQLIAKINGAGSHVFEKSAVSRFDAKKRRARVHDHWVSFGRLIIATNNPLVGLANMASATLFQTKLALYTSYVFGARVPLKVIPECIFWNTRDPYDYLRIDRRKDFDYAIFGGEDHKTGQIKRTEKPYARLLARLKRIIPAAHVDYRWSGQIISTPDGLPYIGENAERQFISTGFCGNGITFGTISAIMARDWATGGKNPWRDLFAVDRIKIKGATWNYIRENKDYPYYLIKSRFARSRGNSVRELKAGNGTIIKSRGKKVAAYRTTTGKVLKVSAVCTHMGCLVRWNPAESTWDCPCHGSRFKPAGEVIAGPAEEPLSPA